MESWLQSRIAGALTAAAGALCLLPAPAVAPPPYTPRFSCPWSPAVAALCLAYDAQTLADTYKDPQPDARGFVAAVSPSNFGPLAGRPVYAVFVHGNFSAAFESGFVRAWVVAFLERSTGRVLEVAGPGNQLLSDVIPAGAGPIHVLPPPPPWRAACTVSALLRSQRRFAPGLARARRQVHDARTQTARSGALRVLRDLQARVGRATNTIASRAC